jgi:folate-binding protein YgfZ
MRVMSMHAGRLGHLGVLQLTGVDAVQFLQGQISNDSRRLAAGKPLLAAYSSPQGRVLAVLHLLPHSSGVLAILPRELVLPMQERLRKFVLRAKVSISDQSEAFVVVGQTGEDAIGAAGLAVPDRALGYAETDGIGVAQLGPDAGRYWVLGAGDRLAALGLMGDDPAAIENAWRLADIRAGIPQIYAATSESFVAQMLNLDLIDGISFTKGCFTGQEIIARTQHLGRIKRRLIRLQLPPGDWRIGQSLRLPDGRSGRLTELATSGAGFEALAVTNLDVAEGDAETAAGAAAAATQLALPYSLNTSP